MYRRKGRILAGLLALILVCTSSGVSVLADEGTDQGYTAGLCEHHPEHTDDCGYDAASGTPCAYECDICGDNVSEESSEEDSPARDENENMQDDAAPADDDSDSVQDAEQNDSAEVADTKEIVEWTWMDEEEILQQNGNVWGLGVPGASEDNPLTQDALLEMLPKQIDAVLVDGSEAAVDLTWDLSAIPEEGVWTGDYTVTADVDVTYSLGVEVAPLSVEVEVGGGETLTIPTGTIDSAPFQHSIIENTTETPGTTINLFDYWLEERNSDDNPDPGNVSNLGINAGHALNFRASGGNDYDGSWNDYTNGTNPRQGIVANTLGEDGYPRLNGLDTGWRGRDGNESLSYLFNPEYEHNGKASFANVDGLLQVDEQGYYYYDSAKNYAAFYPGSNAFALYTKPGVPTTTTEGEFFPFNSAADVFRENYGKYDIVQSTTNYDLMNHYFGVSMSTRFIQQYGGHTSENGSAVTYEFSGDDDVWVFIDDVLVADLGGIHGAASLSINFATGRVNVEGQRPVTIRSQFEDAGADTSGFDGNTFSDNTYHTLKFFYLERGNSASNMSLKFNLVTVPESDIIKVDQLGHPVAGAVFDLYRAENDSYEISGEPLATGTTDSEGSFILVDDEGYTVSLNDLYNQGVRYLVLRERTVPEGYRSAGDMHLYMYKGNENVDGNIVLLSDNHWETGAYASAKLTAKAPNSVVESYPIGNDQGVMFAVVMKYVGNGIPDLSELDEWRPVSGDPVYDDWQVSDDSSMRSILAAAKANPYTFQIDSSGAYKVEVENLPGDIKNYYFMLEEGEKNNTEFAVMYFYKSDVNSIAQIDEKDAYTIQHVTERENTASEFSREFAVRLYVPNIKNYLLVQKVDDQGNPVTGATFTLYTENPEEDPNAEVYDTVTTRNLSKEGDDPLDMEGGAIFPTEDGEQPDVLPAGTYYLKETATPDGYKLNDKITKIVVDNTGVYADAGNATDGVDVLRGVGSIVKTMVQFATDDGLNTTLHDIKAALQTSNSYDGSNTAWTEPGREMHLQYGNSGAALEYGPTEINGETSPLVLETTEGWSRLVIQQCLEHDGDPGNLKETINNPITALFSGSVTVRVTNERVGSLTISKEVVDEADMASDEEEFTFTLTGSLNNQPLNVTFDAEGSGAPQDGKVSFTNGNATVTLKAQQNITILQLPDGATITIEETQKDGYTTTYKVNDGGQQEGNKVSGLDVDYESSLNVAFTNTYVPMADFSFIKTDREGLTGNRLSGAVFAMYRLTCIDSTHNHDDSLVDVSDANTGEIDSNYEYAGCWELAGNLVTSGMDGMVTFEDLPVNAAEYRLVELKAPGGYALPEGQWRIAYDEGKHAFVPVEGGSAVGRPIAIGTAGGEYYIQNYKPGELPFSGNTGIRMFLLIGGMLMVLGAAGGTGWYMYRRKSVVVHRRRRRHRK